MVAPTCFSITLPSSGSTAIMAVGGDVQDATNKLQRAADEISNWTDQWLINP
jgi:hypothetical protein